MHWEGRPLAGARVSLHPIGEAASDDDDIQTVDSGADGTLAFDIPRAGSFMAHVVWARVLPDGQDADYDSVFSSMSFEVE